MKKGSAPLEFLRVHHHVLVLVDRRPAAAPASGDRRIMEPDFRRLTITHGAGSFPDDQRAMFTVFAAHAAPSAALMFTSGHSQGHEVGTLCGEPLYHASLDAIEYRSLLYEHGACVADAFGGPRFAAATQCGWRSASKLSCEHQSEG